MNMKHAKRFHTFMTAIDDDLLEEAQTTERRKNHAVYFRAAVAACLVLLLGISAVYSYKNTASLRMLSDMGYEIVLPASASDIRYNIAQHFGENAAEVVFVKDNVEYTCYGVKRENPVKLQDDTMQEERYFSWSSRGVNLQMAQMRETTAVSWYHAEEQTQWTLRADADAKEVLTTANELMDRTGLNVMTAPESAEHIAYDVFLLKDLTVAETSFVLDGILYVYRMAATADVREDFADLSGLADASMGSSSTELLWCLAKLTLYADGQGKLIWFDVVPGIVYSLTMHDNASEQSLLQMAEKLFEPAQGEVG
ncbi:MAG: hypothetical protein J6A10_01795 [Peptococcaceae bacterium]|nr:hypothetical protein [Peptococcaceae bacterium]MBO5428682.1 hypothetical protein [Peptococcaceae bacterium]